MKQVNREELIMVTGILTGIASVADMRISNALNAAVKSIKIVIDEEDSLTGVIQVTPDLFMVGEEGGVRDDT